VNLYKAVLPVLQDIMQTFPSDFNLQEQALDIFIKIHGHLNSSGCADFLLSFLEENCEDVVHAVTLITENKEHLSPDMANASVITFFCFSVMVQEPLRSLFVTSAVQIIGTWLIDCRMIPQGCNFFCNTVLAKLAVEKGIIQVMLLAVCMHINKEETVQSICRSFRMLMCNFEGFDLHFNNVRGLFYFTAVLVVYYGCAPIVEDVLTLFCAMLKRSTASDLMRAQIVQTIHKIVSIQRKAINAEIVVTLNSQLQLGKHYCPLSEQEEILLLEIMGFPSSVCEQFAGTSTNLLRAFEVCDQNTVPSESRFVKVDIRPDGSRSHVNNRRNHSGIFVNPSLIRKPKSPPEKRPMWEMFRMTADFFYEKLKQAVKNN